MNDVDLVAGSLDQLRSAYRDAARAHKDASSAGRHRVANRSVDSLIALVRELRARGRSGEQVLEELLTDEELSVRAWAAAHSLPFATAAAERVLESIASGPPSPVRLDAEVTLSEWRAGRLQSP